MVLQFHGKLLLEGLPGGHDSSPSALFQYASVPVIGPHHPEQDAVLQPDGEADTNEEPAQFRRRAEDGSGIKLPKAIKQMRQRWCQGREERKGTCETAAHNETDGQAGA